MQIARRYVRPVGGELEYLCGTSNVGNQGDELRHADIKLDDRSCNGIDARLRVAQPSMVCVRPAIC